MTPIATPRSFSSAHAFCTFSIFRLMSLASLVRFPAIILGSPVVRWVRIRRFFRVRRICSACNSYRTDGNLFAYIPLLVARLSLEIKVSCMVTSSTRWYSSTGSACKYAALIDNSGVMMVTSRRKIGYISRCRALSNGISKQKQCQAEEKEFKWKLGRRRRIQQQMSSRNTRQQFKVITLHNRLRFVGQ